MRVFIPSLMVCLPGICQSIAGEVTKPPGHAPACIELRDQYDAPQRLAFPATNVVVPTIADKKGSEQIDGWVAALKSRYAKRIELRGLADVGGVPGLFRGKVRKNFQESRTYPVMMDWSGKICAQLGFQPGLANVLVIDGVAYNHLKSQRVMAIKVESGRELWTSDQSFGKYMSLVAQADRILALDQRGQLLQFRANKQKFDLLDQRKLTDSETWAHLAVAGDQLFVRELNGLVAYRWARDDL